jgi:hypothetical protein
VRLRGRNASCARRLLRRPFECFRFGCGAIRLSPLYYIRKGGLGSSAPTDLRLKRADYSGWRRERQVVAGAEEMGSKIENADSGVV